MLKKLTLILLAVLTLTLFVSCAEPAENTDPEAEIGENLSDEKENVPEEDLVEVINVATLKGPTGMGMAKLISDNTDGKYNVTIASAPDEVTAKVIHGEVDIAAVPVNLASVLYNKTEGDVKVAAINTLGVLYVLDKTGEINTVSDLAGKTVYATGQASTPEYILKYVLDKNGINFETDMELIFKADHSELVTLLAADENVQIAMLPEPNVTSAIASSGATRAISLNESWDAVCDTKLIQGCIIVSKSFAENHASSLNKFLEEYAASVEYVNANIEEASAMIAEIGIIPKAEIAKSALPNCNIVYIDGADMKADMQSFLEILHSFDPKSVGGALPADDFYYEK